MTEKLREFETLLAYSNSNTVLDFLSFANSDFEEDLYKNKTKNGLARF